MDLNIVLAGIVLAPVVVLTLFRANAAVAFLALCLGNLLGTYVASDAGSFLRGYIAPADQVTQSAISLILLWLPVVLVAVFMARTIGKSQRLINILPALAVGLVGLLLSEPFLTPGLQATLNEHEAWGQFTSYQAAVVLGGTVVSLALLRMRNKGDEGGKHKKHH